MITKLNTSEIIIFLRCKLICKALRHIQTSLFFYIIYTFALLRILKITTMNMPLEINAKMQIPNLTNFQLAKHQKIESKVPKQPMQLKEAGVFLSYAEIKDLGDPAFFNILIGVTIAIIGLLYFFLPGLKPIIGGTTARISGVLKYQQNHLLGWNDFWKQIGLYSAICFFIYADSFWVQTAQNFSSSAFRAVIKGAVIGALTTSTVEFIKLRYDPCDSIYWKYICFHILLSTAISIMQFRATLQAKKKQINNAFWEECKKNVGTDEIEKFMNSQYFQSKWSTVTFKIQKAQQPKFPQLFMQHKFKNLEIPLKTNQAVVHFLFYNGIEELSKKKGFRLPKIIELLNIKDKVNNNSLFDQLMIISHELDMTVLKTEPYIITLKGPNRLKQAVSSTQKIPDTLQQLRKKHKMDPWGMSKKFNVFKDKQKYGVRIITFSKYVQGNFQPDKYCTIIVRSIKQLLKK